MFNPVISILKAIENTVDFFNDHLSELSEISRDLIEDLSCVLIAFIINIFSIPLIIFVENYQSKKGGFPIDVGDIERRTFIAAASSLLELTLYLGCLTH